MYFKKLQESIEGKVKKNITKLKYVHILNLNKSKQMFMH